MSCCYRRHVVRWGFGGRGPSTSGGNTLLSRLSLLTRGVSERWCVCVRDGGEGKCLCYVAMPCPCTVPHPDSTEALLHAVAAPNATQR